MYVLIYLDKDHILDLPFYINASPICMPHNDAFIASQGPLDHTVENFWNMIYAKNVKLIIMLCNVQEKGRPKCAKYWPSKKLSLNKMTIELSSEEKDTNLVSRKFTLNDNTASREVTQLHFTSWPDHGVPDIDEVYDDFIRMIEKVDEMDSPVVVHCSAGIGRTGTFMSFYNIHKMLKNSNTISIFNIVRKLKEQRRGSVENVLQYKLIYSFLDKYIKKLI